MKLGIFSLILCFVIKYSISNIKLKSFEMEWVMKAMQPFLLLFIYINCLIVYFHESVVDK